MSSRARDVGKASCAGSPRGGEDRGVRARIPLGYSYSPPCRCIRRTGTCRVWRRTRRRRRAPPYSWPPSRLRSRAPDIGTATARHIRYYSVLAWCRQSWQRPGRSSPALACKRRPGRFPVCSFRRLGRCTRRRRPSRSGLAKRARACQSRFCSATPRPDALRLVPFSNDFCYTIVGRT